MQVVLPALSKKQMPTLTSSSSYPQNFRLGLQLELKQVTVGDPGLLLAGWVRYLFLLPRFLAGERGLLHTEMEC